MAFMKKGPFKKGPLRKGGLAARRKKKVRFREQAKCRFCREKTLEIDYKDIPTMSKLVTQHGKLFSRKRSGNCASCQRKVRLAIKYARFMALMPYVT
jgi:small subunit ribosomal protein S18